MDISRHPLLQQGYAACLAVEALEASEKQTFASQKMNELMQSINNSLPAQIPKIGEQWPEQGGVNAGLMRGVDGKPDYFLIIPTDASGKNDDVEWGAYGTTIDGANCEFDGLKNTTDLLKSETTHPAAEWAAGVNIEGHNDFYLPARRELSLMYANCPELFDKRWHWSSTQYSAHYAWFTDFGVGRQDVIIKDHSYAVRAVRRYYPLSNSAI